MDRLRARKPEPAEFNPVEGSPSGQIEDRLLIEKLLKKLSAEQRMTLVLREMEQLNYDEIAEVMHVPVGTVRSRLHNARDRFRELWINATRDTR